MVMKLNLLTQGVAWFCSKTEMHMRESDEKCLVFEYKFSFGVAQVENKLRKFLSPKEKLLDRCNPTDPIFTPRP